MEFDAATLELIARAEAARLRAHAPYSDFRVGAAILDEAGVAHVGCNVENVASPLGLCAEANAIGAMVAAGGARIARIAIVGGRTALEACAPCGGCRQRIAEFAGPDTEIYFKASAGGFARWTVDGLLPARFSADLVD